MTLSKLTISVNLDTNIKIYQSNSTNAQKNLALGLATLALSIANTPNAQAVLITGVTASTDMGTLSGSINAIVDGTGLPGNIPSLTGSHAAGTVANILWSGRSETGNITFNLNGTYNIGGFSL